MSGPRESRASSPEQAVGDLLDAAQALDRALREEDDLALEAALASRQEAVTTLEKLVGQSGGVGATRGALEEVLRIDAGVLEEARARMDQTRNELLAIGRAREGTKRIPAGPRLPRFVSRRV